MAVRTNIETFPQRATRGTLTVKNVLLKEHALNAT